MQSRLTEAELTFLKRVNAAGSVALNIESDPERDVAETLAVAGLLRGVRAVAPSAHCTFVLSGEGFRATAPARLNRNRSRGLQRLAI